MYELHTCKCKLPDLMNSHEAQSDVILLNVMIEMPGGFALSTGVKTKEMKKGKGRERGKEGRRHVL